MRRNLASASTGVLVMGAGAAVGLIAADMDADWSADAALQAAAASEPLDEPADFVPITRPVVLTIIEERHITPDPVIIHRKVYTTRTAPSGPRTVVRSSGSSSSSTVARPSRTVVVAAKPAPRPAPAPAPKATRSQAS